MLRQVAQSGRRSEVKTRIVVVEDDPINAKVLRFVLEDESYTVEVATRGSQVFDAVFGQETDLVILDVNLPDIDGFRLCSELRARHYNGPVIFLTGRGELPDKLRGFQIGADDYIVKPYEPLELVVRVQSVVRRFQRADQQSLGTIVRVADAELSVGQLTYQSDSVDLVTLTPTEMRILETLMRNQRIVISRERLIERVWGYDMLGDDNRVDVYIRRLRRKIEPDPSSPRYLHTVRGVGFVFRVEQADELVVPGQDVLEVV